MEKEKIIRHTAGIIQHESLDEIMRIEALKLSGEIEQERIKNKVPCQEIDASIPSNTPRSEIAYKRKDASEARKKTEKKYSKRISNMSKILDVPSVREDLENLLLSSCFIDSTKPEAFMEKLRKGDGIRDIIIEEEVANLDMYSDRALIEFVVETYRSLKNSGAGIERFKTIPPEAMIAAEMFLNSFSWQEIAELAMLAETKSQIKMLKAIDSTCSRLSENKRYVKFTELMLGYDKGKIADDTADQIEKWLDYYDKTFDYLMQRIDSIDNSFIKKEIIDVGESGKAAEALKEAPKLAELARSIQESSFEEEIARTEKEVKKNISRYRRNYKREATEMGDYSVRVSESTAGIDKIKLEPLDKAVQQFLGFEEVVVSSEDRYSKKPVDSALHALFNKITTLNREARVILEDKRKGISEPALARLDICCEKISLIRGMTIDEYENLERLAGQIEERAGLLSQIVPIEKKYEKAIGMAKQKSRSYLEGVEQLSIYRDELNELLAEISEFPESNLLSSKFMEMHKTMTESAGKYAERLSEYYCDRGVKETLDGCETLIAGITGESSAKFSSAAEKADEIISDVQTNTSREIKTADELDFLSEQKQRIASIEDVISYLSNDMAKAAEKAMSHIDLLQLKYYELKEEREKELHDCHNLLQLMVLGADDIFSDYTEESIRAFQGQISSTAKQLRMFEEYSRDRNLAGLVDSIKDNYSSAVSLFSDRAETEIKSLKEHYGKSAKAIKENRKNTMRDAAKLKDEYIKLKNIEEKIKILEETSLLKDETLKHAVLGSKREASKSIERYASYHRNKTEELNAYFKEAERKNAELEDISRINTGYEAWLCDKSVCEIFLGIGNIKDFIADKLSCRRLQEDEGFKDHSFFNSYSYLRSSFKKLWQRKMDDFKEEISLIDSMAGSMDITTQQAADKIASAGDYISCFVSAIKKFDGALGKMAGPSLDNAAKEIEKIDSLIISYGKLKEQRIGSLNSLYMQFNGLGEDIECLDAGGFRKTAKGFARLSKTYGDCQSWMNDEALGVHFTSLGDIRYEKMLQLEKKYNSLKGDLNSMINEKKALAQKTRDSAEWYSIITPRIVMISNSISRIKSRIRKLDKAYDKAVI